MISIAMATYNGERYIRKQLDSILSQTIKDFELIICDDCSSDLTVEILREYEKKDSRIHVFVNESNLGFKKNFEKILSLCNGSYIAFSDQDDVWTNNHLDVLLNNIGSFDMVGANAELVDDNENSLGYTMKEVLNITRVPADHALIEAHLFHSNVIQGAACMITSELKTKILPIPEEIKFHDYWAACIATFNNGVTYIDDVILKYRQHQTNVTSNPKYSFLQSIKAIFSPDKLVGINNQLKMLRVLKEYAPSENDALENAICYYDAQMKGKNIKATMLMLKNYDVIYCMQKDSKKLKFYRIIKRVLGL